MVYERPAERTAGDDVPAELLDRQHLVWRDPDRFARWCAREGIDGITETTGEFPTVWPQRFVHARDGWARLHKITGATGRAVDQVALAVLGVPFVGALARAQARAEMRAAQSDADSFR
jgi:hypothetical protein